MIVYKQTRDEDMEEQAKLKDGTSDVQGIVWWWKIKTMRFDIGRLQIHTIWLRQSNFPT
jgi:hypothetical protein